MGRTDTRPRGCREAEAAAAPSRWAAGTVDLPRRVRCLACHGSTLSRVGVSGKPGAVQSEISAYITLQVSVVDPQACKTTSRSLSSNAGNFFDSFTKVLIVGVWRRIVSTVKLRDRHRQYYAEDAADQG
jgi:hypothetical protein